MFGKTKRFKKVFAMMIAAVLLATAAIGCGTGSSDTGATTAAPAATTTAAGTTTEAAAPTQSTEKATVGFMTWESQTMNEAFLNSFKAFTDANPNIKVQLVASPLADYGTKLQQMISANQAPEIFYAGNDMEQQYGEQGLLYDWTSYAEKEPGFLDKYYSGVIDSWKVDGKLMGLPGLMNVYGVFYNKKLFKDAGIAEPKPGWTVQNMLDAAKALAKPEAKQYGLYHYGFDAFTLGMYGVTLGGAPFANGITKVTKVEVSQQFKDVVQLFVDAMKNGSVQPNTYDTSSLEAQFMAGKVPMMYHGQWHADGFIRNAKDLEWGFAPNPIGSTQSTIYDCVGFGSPSKLDHPDAVWQVLKYIDTKTYEIVLPTTPVAPTAYTESAQPFYNKLKEVGHQETADAIDYMLQSPNKQPVRFLQGWAGDAQKYLDADWNNILAGKTPVSKLDEIAKNINDIIAKNQ